MEETVFPVNILVEGDVDEVVVRRVLECVGLTCGRVFGKEGKPAVLSALSKYNQAARFTPWLVVVDLDQDAECAPPFVRTALPQPADRLLLRVAVRAVEAWLMADAERLADYLHIRPNRVPGDPDAEPDPKQTMVHLARQSRREAIRRDMVPREGSGARIGPAYESRLIEFATRFERPWRPEEAARRSDSLRRCVEALKRLRESA